MLYQLKSYLDDDLLYEGDFESLTECLEQAVSDRVKLDAVDLRMANLCNANLDDAYMNGALLTGANLSGANLSEAALKHANFSCAALYNTCLCYADLSGAYFDEASFGGTDIACAAIDNVRFAGPSCFSLNFSAVKSMNGCVFQDESGQLCSMSSPPVVIHGLLRQSIILMDQDMKVGERLRPRPKFGDFLMEQAKDLRKYGVVSIE